MSVMPLSEKHFYTVANSLCELKDIHFKIDWHDTKELVKTWCEMHEHAYNERYRSYLNTPELTPDFEEHVSKGKVDDVQLLKLLKCIAYNTPVEVKPKKWIDARKKLERVINELKNKIISEHTNYALAEWAI